ncbi:MAG: helix-turn-helix domain-containing protein [Fuerstiella sp.]
MQNIHYVAALNHDARFVHVFRVDPEKWPMANSDMAGRQLGENLQNEEDARQMRATFAECLYSREPQECVVHGPDDEKYLCRFESVKSVAGRLRSDDEVVAIAVACDLPDHVDLTAREREIVRLISRDMTSEEIGSELNIKSTTIDTHRQNIRQKLGVKGTSGIVLFAIRHGLVDP